MFFSQKEFFFISYEVLELIIKNYWVGGWGVVSVLLIQFNIGNAFSK